jgi:flagellar biosynthesis/type III secretory pathway M-ring protein FliF/YscJ
MKAAAKEAIKEFLDEKWTHLTSRVGKWALGCIAAAVVAALVYLILWANGWRQP